MKNPKLYSSIIISLLLFGLGCNHPGMDYAQSKESIEFSSGKFRINGELLFPEGEGPFPLVIMVHGDGPAYMTYYKTLKKTFLKSGYATLMWDKPCFGKSEGEFSKKRLRQERAEILLDGINTMKDLPQIDPDKIGVWGISQAGYVIPYALQQSDDIHFMILVGVGGENGIQQTAYYIKAQMKCIGATEMDAERAGQNFVNLCYAQTFDEYYENAKPLFDDPVQREMGFVSAMWTEEEWTPKDKSGEGFFDPISVIERTKIPTRVFFGDLDKNVDPIQGMQAYQAALKKAKNQNFKVTLIKGADHNIIVSETGCAAERSARSGKGWSNYDPEYLKMMEEWLQAFKERP